MLHLATFHGGVARLRPAGTPEPKPVHPSLDATRTTQHAPASQPIERWPLAIKALALLAKPEDRGIGDIVARTIGPFGGDAFKRWMTRVGINCGCAQRQEDWNARWPLKAAHD